MSLKKKFKSLPIVDNTLKIKHTSTAMNLEFY